MRLAGQEIFLRDSGEATRGVVLFVHSSGMSGGQWRRHGVLFREAGYRVVVPDLIGCGRSAPWERERAFDLKDDVAMLVDLAKSLGTLVLVGHSYGGALSLMAAKELGGGVSHVAVYDPVLWGPHREVHGDAYLATMEERGLLDPAARGTEKWMATFVEYWSGPGGWEKMGAVAREQMMRSAEQTCDQVLSLAGDDAGARSYASIEAPTLILSGTDTPAEMRASALSVAASIPNAEHRVLEGGHMVPLTKTQLFTAAILRWLDAH